MTDERDVLIERYLAGAASPTEATRLEELLRDDPRLLREFVLALDEDVCLRTLVEEETDPRPAARRSSLRRIARPTASTWSPWIAAAGLLMTALLLAVFYSSDPSRQTVGYSRAPQTEPGELARPEPLAPSAPAPEAAQPAKDLTPTVALLLIVDNSASVAGRNIEIVKETCIATAQALSRGDLIGIIAFDHRPYPILPFTEANRIDDITQHVQNLSADGGTRICPALEMAERMFEADARAQRCAIKHAVLLSDGDAPPADNEPVVRRMAEARITVSTVCVSGAKFDAVLMSQIATWGKGRFYFTPSFEKVRQLILNETQKVVAQLPRDNRKSPTPAPTPTAAAPAPSAPVPAPPKPADAAPSPSTTVTAPADPLHLPTIDEVQGEAYVVDAGAKTPVRSGQSLPPGRGLSLADAASRLSLSFADGTRLVFSGTSEIRELSEGELPAKGARGKRIEILQGTLSADVKKQPAAQPMLVQTPHAQAQVLGTGFQLVVEAGEKGQTRLAVREGRVRLLRTGGKSADVAAGFEAAAAAGVDPVARPQDGSSVVLHPDLSLWLRADQGVMLNGAGVSQWTDRSGNGRHAVQGIAVRQPLYVRAAQAGKPALRFDGADDFLAFPCPVTGLSGMTIFLVASTAEERTGGVNGSGNAAVFWHESENFGTVLLTPSPSKVRYFFGTGQSQAVFAYTRPASIDRAWSLTTAEKSGADAVLYVGGQEVFRQSGQKAEIAACEKIGFLGRGEGDKNTNRQFQGQFEGWSYFAGDLAEVIVYSRALPASERVQVEQYLLGKYFPK